jgi:voltage-gated potassium channel
VGDASSDEILRQAHVERATCLLAASDSDSGNTYIVLAAKALNPDLYVVARAAHPDSTPRMRRAGADRVFSPYIIAGRQMAVSAIQPLLTEFIDTHTRENGRRSVLGEIEVTAGSGAGGTVDQLLGGCKNVTVLAIQRKSGELYVGTSGAHRLTEGDRVILLGDEEELQQIRPSAAPA